MPDSRWGFPSGLRSLTQCGEPMSSSQWQRLSTYGTILTASHCGASRRGPGTPRPRAVVCWRLADLRGRRSRNGCKSGSAASVCLIIRDWVLRFNARGPDKKRLVDRKSPGGTLEVLNADRSPPRMAEVVEAGPVPAVDGVVRWRRKEARWLLETFAISLDETTCRGWRELKALGGSTKISARHAPLVRMKRYAGRRGFKKSANFPAELATDPAEAPERRSR